MHTLSKLINHYFADEKEFRSFILWVEDQKIRHYKIEDRAELRNIKSSDWIKAYERVSDMCFEYYWFFFQSNYEETLSECR